ncbi:helix-turn-helix domain-containing protein [Streptomyces misionensis]|uniref:helix-turn-helix domain-containing protein n=1 Tax=Streptomyces misionensis TaxID=67331 RepID=UPI0016466A24|nr:helix-turn-helix domain-containing protein [Streptomyces misionensis]
MIVEHETDRVLAQILPWLSEHLEHELTVDGISEQARVSRRTLTRHFRSHTGMAPLQWVLSQRVHRAQRPLETEDDGHERRTDRDAVRDGNRSERESGGEPADSGAA